MKMNRLLNFATGAAAAITAVVLMAGPAQAQEAKRRWEQQCEIRKEKFDKVLPQAMRDNKIDMWIVAMRDGTLDPNYNLLGRGFVFPVPPATGYYIFTDRGGDRIERMTIALDGEMLERCPTYDQVDVPKTLREFVQERNPRSIGVNVASEIGAADGLTHTLYNQIVKDLGPDLAGRLTSAEKLVSDFRSRRVSAEIMNFGIAGEYSRNFAERALSNEVITPDKTTLADVAWWMWDRLLENGLGSSFDMPSVYVLGPGKRETSNDYIIRHGDLLSIDWGVGYQDMWMDMKRTAYVLKPSEFAVPAGIQNAYDKGKKNRTLMIHNIKSGFTGKETLDRLNGLIAQQPGFALTKEFAQPAPSKDPNLTQIFIGPHSTGDLGHGSGASTVMFSPLQQTYTLHPNDFLSIEMFSYTPIPEWGGKMLTLPLEDDGVVTPNGVDWVYPPNEHIILIR
jgi:Xaa-Pro aminopeptidase